jgi:maleamate amidohydrolase
MCCTTAGCVPTSVVDVCSSGLHTIVVQRSGRRPRRIAIHCQVFEIDAKYGDVVEPEQALGP